MFKKRGSNARNSMAGTPKNKLDVDDVAGERDTSILDDAGAAADANADVAALLPGRISTSKDEEVDEGSEDEDEEEGRDFFSPEAQNNEASYTINEFQMAIAKPKVHAVTRIGLLSAKPKKHKYIIYPVSKFYFLWSEFMWIMVLYTLAILPMEVRDLSLGRLKVALFVVPSKLGEEPIFVCNRHCHSLPFIAIHCYCHLSPQIAFQEIGGNVFLEVVDVAVSSTHRHTTRPANTAYYIH